MKKMMFVLFLLSLINSCKKDECKPCNNNTNACETVLIELSYTESTVGDDTYFTFESSDSAYKKLVNEDCSCMNMKIKFINTPDSLEYLWSDGSDADSILLTDSGEYWLKVCNNKDQCVIDTFNFVSRTCD